MALFGKLFKKAQAEAEPEVQAPVCDPMVIYAPAEGRAIPLSQFPDEVFSSEALGPGCGIEPEGDTVCAPFNGEVTQVIDTKHAVGLTSESGVEVLIHIGVDTVAMNGKGFQTDIKPGQKVMKGEKLITFDRQAIREAGYKEAIAVIVINADDYSSVELTGSAAVFGEPMLCLKK